MNHRHRGALLSVVYPLALLLVVMPFVNVMLSLWPIRISDAPWRFGAFGLVMEAIVFPVLGVALAALGAYWLEHRRALQAIAVTLLAVAGLLAAGLVLFALDTLQVRAMVQPQGRVRFDVTVARAFGSAAFATLLLVWIARGSWKVASEGSTKQRSKQTAQADAAVRRRADASAMPAVSVRRPTFPG